MESHELCTVECYNSAITIGLSQILMQFHGRPSQVRSSHATNKAPGIRYEQPRKQSAYLQS